MAVSIGGLPLSFAVAGDSRPVPGTIQDLVWWDSTRGTYTTAGGSAEAAPGVATGSWVDRNQGIRLDAPATGSRPVLSTVTTLNGAPTLVFDGIDDTLIADSTSSLNWVDDFSFILVFNPLTVGANETYFSRSDGSSSAQYEFRAATGQAAYIGKVAGAAGGVSIINEDTAVSFASRFTILCGQFAPTSLTYGMRANTQAIATTGSWVQSGILNQQSTQRFMINGRNFASPALIGGQAWRHAMFLPRLFSDNERDALERWLLGNTAIAPTFT